MRITLVITLTAYPLIACLSGCATWNPLSTRLSAGSSQKTEVRKRATERKLNLARLAERQGKTDQAQRLYDAVLEVEPQHQVALHRTGILAAEAGQLDLALQKLQAAVQNSTPSAELLADIGFVHYSQGDFSAAEKTLSEALRRSPNDKRVANNLGLAIGIQGRLEEAYAIFQQAGGDAEAHANVAYIRSQLGDLDGAIAGYHAALDRDVELKVAARALVQLDRHPQHHPQHLRPSRASAEQIAVQMLSTKASNVSEAIRRADPVESIAAAQPQAMQRPELAATVDDLVDRGTEPQAASLAVGSDSEAKIATVSYEVVEADHPQAPEAAAATSETQPRDESSGPEDAYRLGESWQVGNSTTWDFGL